MHRRHPHRPLAGCRRDDPGRCERAVASTHDGAQNDPMARGWFARTPQHRWNSGSRVVFTLQHWCVSAPGRGSFSARRKRQVSYSGMSFTPPCPSPRHVLHPIMRQVSDWPPAPAVAQPAEGPVPLVVRGGPVRARLILREVVAPPVAGAAPPRPSRLRPRTRAGVPCVRRQGGFSVGNPAAPVTRPCRAEWWAFAAMPSRSRLGSLIVDRHAPS